MTHDVADGMNTLAEQIAAAKRNFAGGRRAQAAQALIALAHRHPSDVRLQLEAGAMGLRADLVQEAVTPLERAVAQRPDVADGWALLGEALFRLGQSDKAVAALTKARRGLPRNADVLALLAQAQEQAGYLAEAVVTYAAAVDLRPDDAKLLALLGMSLATANRIDDAIDALRRAEALDPSLFTVQARLAGLIAQRHGFDAARPLFDAAVAKLKAHLDAGRYDEALVGESRLIDWVVRKVESEDHAETCLSAWRDAMTEAGRRAALPRPSAPRSPAAVEPPKVGFFIHSATLLGHVEVLFDYLAAIQLRTPRLLSPIVYVFSGTSAALAEAAAKRGIALTFVETEWPGGRTFLPYRRLVWLRERLAQDGVAALVWVSVQKFVHFAAALGVAPVNIFWALRFRGVSSPDVQGYVACASCFEHEDTVHGRRWDVVPLAFADLKGPQRARDADEIRRRLGSPAVVLGTMARAEKMQGDAWLEAIGLSLRACPEAVFVWAGRREDDKVAATLRKMGVAAQSRFVGWVDTRLHAQVIDIFLDTAPVGCGLTAMEAMAWGKPLVSFKDPLTNWGQCLRPVLEGRIDDAMARAEVERIFALGTGRELLAWVDTPQDYARMVRRLIDDPTFGTDVGRAGQTFTMKYFGDPAYAAERLAQIIVRTIERARGPTY